MMDFVLIDKAFYDWAVAITKRQVIWLNENAPMPALPYLTLHRLPLIPIGHDFYSPVNEEGKAKLGGIRGLTLQVNSYGSNAAGMLELISSSFWIDEYRSILSAEGISFLNRFAINDLSGLLDTRYEERAQADYSFLIGRESAGDAQIDVGIIKNVEGEGTIKTYDKSTIRETDFEIVTNI
jgi:hypothetical protein